MSAVGRILGCVYPFPVAIGSPRPRRTDAAAAYFSHVTLISALSAVGRIIGCVSGDPVAIGLPRPRRTDAVNASFSHVTLISALSAICGVDHQACEDAPTLCRQAVTLSAKHPRWTCKTALSAVGRIIGCDERSPVAKGNPRTIGTAAVYAYLSHVTEISALSAVGRIPGCVYGAPIAIGLASRAFIASKGAR